MILQAVYCAKFQKGSPNLASHLMLQDFSVMSSGGLRKNGVRRIPKSRVQKFSEDMFLEKQRGCLIYSLDN